MTDARRARHAYLILLTLSVTIFLYSIIITDATDTTSNFPKRERQYDVSDMLFFNLFFNLIGNLLHGKPITMAKSLSENLTSLPK